MKIIAIASQKGGCGKTTTAINLAAALATCGRKTLLIDLDPQSHATLGLNVNSQNSIYNTLSKISPKKMRIDDIIVTIMEGFDLAPSNILLGTIEQELADEIGREARMKEELDKMKSSYDYVIIDCPPNLGLLTINAIRAADEVLIPVETSRFSMIGVERLLEIIDLVKDRLNHPVELKVLVTMFDSRLRHSFNMLKTIRSLYSDRLFDTIVHINVKLKESIVSGLPVILFDKYCRGSKDYSNLARELLHADRVDTDTTIKDIMESKPTRDFIEQTFTITAPQAKAVYITGDFNEWKTDDTNRLNQDNGKWRATLQLKKGTYHYKYVVDGLWQHDPDNPRIEENSFGSYDSVIEIK